jgi:hypothetical protein
MTCKIICFRLGMKNPVISYHWVVKRLKYRIYSRISREILDTFWHLFFEFDLYTGHKTWLHYLGLITYLGIPTTLKHI